MDTSECWALVAGQRRDLADAVAGLPGDAWDTPSLCAGWRVREVVAHVLGNAEGAFTPRRALPGLLAHRFNVDAFLFDDARRRGAASRADLVTRLRAAAANTYRPPGRKPADVLADAVVHCQDVCTPLGIDRHASGGAVLAALERAVRQTATPHTGRRAAGLRLHATDLRWQWGHGEEVTGNGEALLMALAGRGTFAARLSGPGAATLAARCQADLPGANQPPADHTSGAGAASDQHTSGLTREKRNLPHRGQPPGRAPDQQGAAPCSRSSSSRRRPTRTSTTGS